MSLSIIVHKGDPDFRQYRHTSLYIESQDGNKLLQVSGIANEFNFESLEDPPAPNMNKAFRTQIPVQLSTAPSSAVLEALIHSTTINNTSNDWNCQGWVRDALKSLVLAGVVSSASQTKVTDEMNKVLAEVPLDAL